jgi:hypothetical protein
LAVSDAPEYDLLLQVRIRAEVAPEDAIPQLKLTLKRLLRVGGYKCVDYRHVPFPAKGKPALPKEAPCQERKNP